MFPGTGLTGDCLVIFGGMGRLGNSPCKLDSGKGLLIDEVTDSGIPIKNPLFVGVKTVGLLSVRMRVNLTGFIPATAEECKDDPESGG